MTQSKYTPWSGSPPKRVSKSKLRDFYQAAKATGLLNPEAAMIEAAAEGRTQNVQALLDAGADVHASVSPSGNYNLWVPHDEALCQAAGAGHTETVKTLLAAGANVHVSAGQHEEFPLCQAASGGYVETLKVLLKAGADIHAGGGCTRDQALRDAAWHGKTSAVKFLLAAGADNYRGAIRAVRESPRGTDGREETLALLQAEAKKKGLTV